MATHFDSDPAYANFEILRADYKTVDSVPINVDVLVPKNLTSGSHPIIARFHGGGFTSGSSLHTKFFPKWVLELAVIMGAIIITPNYRLLPESNAVDILEDLDDLWEWQSTGLPDLLASSLIPGLRADLTRILTVGESAGGYLSVQYAIDHVGDGVRACVAECPGLNLRTMAGTPMAQDKFDSTTAANVPSKTASNPPVISDPTLSRFGIINELAMNGTLLNYFPDVERVHPLERIQNGSTIPPTFLIHGLDDSVVPSDQSRLFMEEVLKHNPNAKIHLELQPGEHLMDIPLRLGHPWLTRGVRFVTGAWLG